MDKILERMLNKSGIFLAGILFAAILFVIALAADTIPPSINKINATPGTLSQGDLLNITANVTDDIAVDAVLVEVNNANYSMERILYNDTLFSDGFESGILSAYWKTSGTVTVNDTDPFEGAFYMEAVGGSIIERNITTSGYSNIDFSFYAKTPGLDIGDVFQIDWHNGTDWVNLIITHDEADEEFLGITGYRFFGFSLPDSASDKENITMRFTCTAAATEFCYIDNVVVEKSSMAETVSYDGFESNDLSNWTTSGAGAAWVINYTDPLEGTYHLKAEPNNLDGSFIEKNLSALGYRNIDVSFYAKTPLLDSGDAFQADWYNGTDWVNLIITHDEAEDEFLGITGYRFFGFSLPDSADNKDNITIRLGCKAAGLGEVCYVDNFMITKVPLGDLWSYTYNTTGLSSGSNNYTIYANDSSGNSATPKKGNFTILANYSDTIAPDVALDKPDNDHADDSMPYVSIVFNGTASDDYALNNCTLYHNMSGVWKANLTMGLSGTSSTFNFSLNLTNATFVWNVEACDSSGNCNFSSQNRTVILNYTKRYLHILNFTPLNNSYNISLECNITAFFDKDIDQSTLNPSNIIMMDSSSNIVEGKIEYLNNSKKLRFEPYLFLKENETYSVNLTEGIRGEGYGIELVSDFIWGFTTELKDTDNDGIPDEEDNDDDNDNINDSEDFLKGNCSHIKTGISNLTVRVNQSMNLSKRFTKKERVQFFSNNSLMIEFNFSFSNSSILDLTNITVEKNYNSSLGSLAISGLRLNNSKTFYIDNISSHHGVCIRDADTASILQISYYCNKSHETFLKCPGRIGNYNCTVNGTRFKITGLNHSGVKQSDDNTPPRINLISVSYSGSGPVTATLTVITNEDALCKYDTQDVSFSSMSYSMSGSGTQHSGERLYSEDASGTYYVLCRDEFGNTMTSSNSISFNADVSESQGGGSSGGGGGTSTFQCKDGIDNDGDNLIDYPADPDCVGYSDNSEGTATKEEGCTENWICDSWGKCMDGFQTRKCFELNDCRTESHKPDEFQTCSKDCEEIWQCDPWSVCSEGMRKRECYDLNSCSTEAMKPSEYEECEFVQQCYNSIQDNGEEGIDCGGLCPACETCYDRVKNNGEEGIDCGGPCRKCRIGDIIATGMNIMVLPENVPKTGFFVVFLTTVFLIYIFIRQGYMKNIKRFIKPRHKNQKKVRALAKKTKKKR